MPDGCGNIRSSQIRTPSLELFLADIKKRYRRNVADIVDLVSVIASNICIDSIECASQNRHRIPRPPSTPTSTQTPAHTHTQNIKMPTCCCMHTVGKNDKCFSIYIYCVSFNTSTYFIYMVYIETTKTQLGCRMKLFVAKTISYWMRGMLSSIVFYMLKI